eukprot:m.73709 g.73709  ORF g.73709 m.73709 type:complete len:354 (-) comp18829_c0_seq3:2367-3428(-)
MASSSDPMLVGLQAADSDGRCGRCGNGAAVGARLLVCKGCDKILYCSRECQVAHWKDKTEHGHKAACKAACRTTASQPKSSRPLAPGAGRPANSANSANSAAASTTPTPSATWIEDGDSLGHAKFFERRPGESQAEQMARLKDHERKLRKARKSAQKAGTPMLYMPLFTVTPEVAAEYTRDELLERLMVLYAAHQEFAGHKDNTRNLRYERLYTELYHDFLLHSGQWFGLFASDKNCVYAERCIGILGTLATIHRQRGAVSKAEEILELDEQVLDRYVDMTSRSSDSAQHSCCRGLQYRFWLIKVYGHRCPLSYCDDGSSNFDVVASRDPTRAIEQPCPICVIYCSIAAHYLW